MEDDYLPLYEVVDHENPNGIANNSAYERLIIFFILIQRKL